MLPTQRFMLPKGAFIDCTLETAISSALPGMTTCVTATDTFGADGNIVLLERGSKLVGETRGQVQQGKPRLFVLWTEARTPTGVVVPLASPGTDELGRSGLSGVIDRHWWLRFGTAILITVIDGAVQGFTESHGSGGTIVLNPSTSSDVATEVLRGTLNVPPTIEKAQGDRIEILVARDVDFRSVYALHAKRGRPLMDGIRMRAETTPVIDTAPRPTPSTFVHAAQISSLALTLRVLQPLLSRQDVTEICINRPGEAFLETRTGWERETLPFADFHWCYRLAKLDRECDAPADHRRIAAPVGCASDRRAHPNRGTSGDAPELRGDHDPKTRERSSGACARWRRPASFAPRAAPPMRSMPSSKNSSPCSPPATTRPSWGLRCDPRKTSWYPVRPGAAKRPSPRR